MSLSETLKLLQENLEETRREQQELIEKAKAKREEAAAIAAELHDKADSMEFAARALNDTMKAYELSIDALVAAEKERTDREAEELAAFQAFGGKLVAEGNDANVIELYNQLGRKRFGLAYVNTVIEDTGQPPENAGSEEEVAA